MRLGRTYLLPLFLVTVGCVYLATLCPVVYLGDSGELTAAAFCLGVPHGSGYPLYAILGKLFCLLPVGNVGFRMNLMSAVFGVLTVWVIYSLIYRTTKSRIGSFVGAGVFAFIPVFWWQTVAAEVYTLHAFMVALMIWILRRWDETGEFYLLSIFAFVTGLSFGNHMQTVMLAPAVFTLILWHDRKALLGLKPFLMLSSFFCAALLVYGYLPIRTWMDAAIHWGDPDSWDRFLAHVTGRSHRGGYVFNLTLGGYLGRTKESLELVWDQFGVMVLMGLWGLARVRSLRWRIFFLLVVLFDFFYTVFLNTISLQITPFNLSTGIILAVGIGIGVHDLIKKCEDSKHVRAGAVGITKLGWLTVPLIYLALNYPVSNQSRNHIAHEHAGNILRTTDLGDSLFVEADNNFFPLIYARLVERMREDVVIYDRLDLVFKTPYVGDQSRTFYGDWKGLRSLLEKEIIKRTRSEGVFFAVFEKSSISLPPSYKLVPYCLIYRAVLMNGAATPYRIPNLWVYYASESFYDHFEPDFMSRQVKAHFFIRYGEHLFSSGNSEAARRYVTEASRVGYDDEGIHSMAATIFMKEGLFDLAREELDKASQSGAKPAIMHNNWGCYHFRQGDYESAITSFKRAIEADRSGRVYYVNLSMALKKAGREEEAKAALRQAGMADADSLDSASVDRQSIE
jgi:tetratricopeptide (TPR) repeat protein